MNIPFNVDDINEKALYVLRKENDGSFDCKYIEIDDDLSTEIDLEYIINFCKKKDIDTIEKINTCNNLLDKLFNEYTVLFYERSYCSKYALRSHYCDFKTIYNREEIEIIAEERSYINGRSIEMMLQHISVCQFSFESWINQFIHSHLMEKCYEKCSNDRNNTAFSHRKVGFTGYDYTLNESLAVNVSTNFSYGHASYFFITLKYKGIQIIPYSRLVHYRIIDVKQLIRHTREYECFDANWKDALDFVKDASNDFIKNGDNSFISKYIINECEKIAQLLPQYLITNVFELSETLNGTFFGSRTTFTMIELEGYDLHVFRGEKMSGALSYIANIKKLSELIPSQKYIDCIEKCANAVLPELSTAITNLEFELKDINGRVDSLKVIISGESKYSSKEINDFYSTWDQLKSFMLEINKNENKNLKIEIESIYNELLIQYPEYKEPADIYISKVKLLSLNKESNYLKDCYNKIAYYYNTIIEYFNPI